MNIVGMLSDEKAKAFEETPSEVDRTEFRP